MVFSLASSMEKPSNAAMRQFLAVPARPAAPWIHIRADRGYSNKVNICCNGV